MPFFVEYAHQNCYSRENNVVRAKALVNLLKYVKMKSVYDICFLSYG